jgi:hypothetical protein
MSEYQFYEFQAIDRPLSKKEMQEIARLSRRVELTPYQAIFVYNYGDFPAKADKILAKYFDAMIYLANWGTRRLMFRFPESIVNIKEIEQYCFRDLISLDTADGYVMLDINFCDENSCAWIEDNDWLSLFLPLRHDLMQQDYRLLYLAWLKAITLEPPDERKEEYIHPPVPPGLKHLSQPLSDFLELFEVDEFLVRAAAKFSPERKEIVKSALQIALSKLSQDECRDFLLRLALNEPYLSVQLKRRLEGLTKQDPGDPLEKPDRLPVLALLDQAERERELEAEKQKALEEAKRKQELEKLSKQEPQLWKEVDTLIAKKQIKAYDEAVNTLMELRKLAEYQGTGNRFQEKINQLHQAHTRLPGLIWRMQKNGLAPGED